MQKTDNIYIDALKYAASNMRTGVSYNEVTLHLNHLGWVVENDFKDYWILWFYTHFYNKNNYVALKNGNQGQVDIYLKDVHMYADIKYHMTSEAFEIYQDFEKLKQAKADSAKALENSVKANALARRALYVAIAVGFLQIVLQLYSLLADNNHFCLICLFH